MILRQNDGRLKLMSSFDDSEKSRIVILEAGKDGRVRTVTTFPKHGGDPYRRLVNNESLEILDVSKRIKNTQDLAPGLEFQTPTSQHGTALRQAGVYGKREASLPPSPVDPIISRNVGAVDQGLQFPSRKAFEMIRNIPVPPEKARVIEGIWKAHVAPREAMNELEKIWKGYTNLWKGYTLFPFEETTRGRNALLCSRTGFPR